MFYSNKPDEKVALLEFDCSDSRPTTKYGRSAQMWRGASGSAHAAAVAAHRDFKCADGSRTTRCWAAASGDVSRRHFGGKMEL